MQDSRIRQTMENEEEKNKPPDQPVPKPELSKNILNFANLFIAVVIIAIFIFLWRIRIIIGIFLASTVLSVLLTPAVRFLEKHRFPRVSAILTIYSCFLALFALIITLLIPVIYEQALSVKDEFPRYWQSIVAIYDDLEKRLNVIGLGDTGAGLFNISPTERQTALTNAAQKAIAQGWDYILATASVITTIISIPVITFYMLKDGPVIRQSLLGLLPETWRGSATNLLHHLSGSVYSYIKGQMLLCVVIFAITLPVLLILGVPFAILLAVLAGLTEFIPIIGPTIALIPAVLIAIFAAPPSVGLITDLQPLWRGLIVMLSYFGIQLSENNIFAPRIMGSAMGLHPLGVIFALLCGAILAGIWGMLLSLPVAAAVKVIYQFYYPSFIKRIDNLLSFE